MHLSADRRSGQIEVKQKQVVWQTLQKKWKFSQLEMNSPPWCAWTHIELYVLQMWHITTGETCERMRTCASSALSHYYTISPHFRLCVYTVYVYVNIGYREESGHTLSHSGTWQGLFGTTEPQLATHHGGSMNVPVVVTHCPPLSVPHHLHSPLANHSSASKTHQRLLRKQLIEN